MFARSTIRTKILVVLTAVAVVSVGVSSWIGFSTTRRALEEQAFRKLTAAREMRADHIEDYFQQIVHQAVTLSESRAAIDAIRDFRSAFSRLETENLIGGETVAEQDLSLRLYYQQEYLPRLNANLETQVNLMSYWPAAGATRALQYHYIVNNPFDAGQKHLLDDPGDESAYTAAHRVYHPIFRNFLDRFGYYDLFLIDHETGQIVYSVYKEVDFGTSLLSGPYRDTNFARAFGVAKASQVPEFVRFVDFEPYHPSYDAEAAFIASPVFDESHRKVGVLVLQMPVERINDIMTSGGAWSEVGQGETGETYLVGADRTMRNEPRFLIEDKDAYLSQIGKSRIPLRIVERIKHLGSALGVQEVRTEGVRRALAGETGESAFPDYRGVPVLSSFRPLSIQDLDWAIMSEIDQEEAFAPVQAFRNKLIPWILALILGILLVAFSFSRTLTRRLVSLTIKAGDLAGGDLHTQIETNGNDEIADLATSLESMRKSLCRLVKRQEAEIEALATPLIPLRDDVVAMPLVGDLDPQRIDKARQTLIQEIHAGGVKAALLDLTGVPRLDEASAMALMGTAKAARLLGARVVITGLRPEIAQGLADLDLHLDGITTERSLQSGMKEILKSIDSTRTIEEGRK